MGFSKKQLLNPWDDLKRQQTSPRAPQPTPVKKFTSPVIFMLAAGAYTWRP